MKKKSLLTFSFSIFVIITLFCNSPIISFGSSSLDTIEPGDNTVIALIYNDLPEEAQFSESLLENKGYPTDIFNVSEANSAILSNYELILIGRGTAGSFYEEWRDPSKVLSIDNLKKPIIGIGGGGASFFENLSLDIGYSKTMWTNIDYVNVINPTHPMYNRPNNITKSSDLKIYNQTAQTLIVYVPSVIEDLTLIGKFTPTSHYSLIMQQYRYFLWGYNTGLSYLTETGEDLFINVIHYFIGSVPSETGDDIPGYNIFILMGVISLTLLALLTYRLKKGS